MPLYDVESRGRIVVQNTFLSVVSESDDEEQPSNVQRSSTDSVLCGPGRGALRCVDYKPGSPSTAASTPWVSDSEENAVAHGVAASERRRPQPHSDSSRSTPQENGQHAPQARERPVRGAHEGAASGRRQARERVDNRTTLMLRNLPNSYTRAMFLELLNSEGFTGEYDFIYLPIDFARGCNLGYAFVNLVDPSLVPRFRLAFNGFSNWRLRTSKICQVTWSDQDQGFRANVKRYRNSPVMHPSVPESYRPCLFANGVQIPFPAPHGRLQRPTGRRS